MTNAKPAHSEFQDLGLRLVRFGQALQDNATSVGQLNRLAKDCGITLRLRAVANTEGASHAHPR